MFHQQTTAQGVDYAKRIEVAKKQALEALPMSIQDRLKRFSFLSRFKGPFGTLNKKTNEHKKKRRHDTGNYILEILIFQNEFSIYFMTFQILTPRWFASVIWIVMKCNY